MNNTLIKLGVAFLVCSSQALRLPAQSIFQNLDFESPTFISIPNDPYDRVQFQAAMPGWTGYIGSSPINWILHNDLFLSNLGISILGPDYPSAGPIHGHYFVMLQGNSAIPAAITQTGMVPLTAASVRFYSDSPFASFNTLNLSFAGNSVPIYNLGGVGGYWYTWGGDISAFAGQTGELRFSGGGYLDYIQFSSQPIPEPGSLALLGAGGLALVWRFRRKRP